MDIKQRIAAKAVIVKDGKVLVLREAASYDEGTISGRYMLPGGRVEPGEPYADALIREVLEETGLTIEILEPLYAGEWRPTIKGVPHQIVGLFFHCTATSDKITLSEEHDNFLWVVPLEHSDVDIAMPDTMAVDAAARVI